MIEAGLTADEAARRLREHGPNEMSTVRLARKVFDVVRSILNPLVIILLVAGSRRRCSASPCKPRSSARWSR